MTGCLCNSAYLSIVRVECKARKSIVRTASVHCASCWPIKIVLNLLTGVLRWLGVEPCVCDKLAIGVGNSCVKHVRRHEGTPLAGHAAGCCNLCCREASPQS